MTHREQENVPLEWQVGDTILETYKIERKIESGGMGIVYRARHLHWNIDLAIKSPREALFDSDAQIANFEREAETWVSLGLHPHVVACFYVQRLGGIPRIVAEFVHGGTLAEWIQSGKIGAGSDADRLRRILDIAIQIAWGLHFAHEKGLVHQDVKPGNILMTQGGLAKVADFGLSNALKFTNPHSSAGDRPGQSIMVPCAGFLTREYASPEQFRGEPLTRRSDIWSWAVLVLEMLKGECDWQDGRVAPEVLSELYGDTLKSDPLGRLLEQCLRASPTERPSDFDIVSDELVAIWQATRGDEYFRTQARGELLEVAAMNNRAVSMLELGANSDTERTKDAWSLFSDLKNRFPLNKAVRLNCALFRWLHWGAPIVDLDREIDMILQLPGPPVDPDWLVKVELAKQNTRRAMLIPDLADAHIMPISARHASLKDQFQNLFEQFEGETENRSIPGAPQPLFENSTRFDSDPKVSERNPTSHVAVVEIQQNPHARITVRQNGNPLPIFERQYSNQFYTAAALDQTQSIIAIMQLKVNENHSAENRESTKIAVEVVCLSTGETLLDAEDHYNDADTLKMIEQAGCRVAVDSSGTYVQLWILASPHFAARPGARRVLIANKGGRTSWFHDFRHAEPCDSQSAVFKLSADGSRLLTATPSTAQIWAVKNGEPCSQTLEVDFFDFGLLKRAGMLPGFLLDDGFEFNLNEACGYALLDALLRLESDCRGLIALFAPNSLEALLAQQRSYDAMLAGLPDCRDLEAVDQGIALFDAATESSLADVSELLRKRWIWTNNFPDKTGVKAWHVRSHDEYWARPIYSARSQLANEFTFLRKGSFPEFTCQPIQSASDQGRFAHHVVRTLECEENCVSLGAVSNFGHLTMRPLTGSTETPSRLELHQLGPNLQSETPIWGIDVHFSVYEQMHITQFVAATDRAIFAKTDADEIAIVKAEDATRIARISVESSITGIYPILDHAGRSSECVVSTDHPFQLIRAQEDGRISVLKLPTKTESNWTVKAVSSDGSTFVVKKLYGEIVVASSLTVEWRETRIWSPFERFAPWVGFQQRAPRGMLSDLLNTPNGWTLSHCGRLLACVCDLWLLVLDVPACRCLLKWELRGRGVENLCFDLSGRWLVLTHSGNIWEEFEIMWNPVESKEPSIHSPESTR